MAETGHIFEQWAKHLEAKASGIVVASVVVGGLIGAVLGGVPLFHLSNGVVPHHLGYATLLIGAAAGGYLGRSFGERRATGLRLQAEVARRQFQVEQSLIRRMMQLAPTPPVHQAAAPAPAPVPVPVPVSAPAPVAAMPVAPAPVAPAPVAPAPVAPPPAPAPVPVVAPPAPVAPLLTTPPPVAPAVPPVVAPVPVPAPIPAPLPDPPPAAAYAPQQPAQPPLTGTDA
jgi:hypothetical protein